MYVFFLEIILKNTYTAQSLLDFLNDGHSMFHATENLAKMYAAAGFTELFEQDGWKLEHGQNYFVRRNNSGIMAFRCPQLRVANGFRIIGTHTDAPGFKIKPGNCLISHDGYVQLNTEPYGGAILNTWFDRPLSIAGKVVIATKDACTTKSLLIDVAKPVLMIPNLCIHFNRDVNNGVSINKQKDLLPILCMANPQKKSSDYLKDIIIEEINKKGIDIANPDEEILDYELYLYETDKGSFVGFNDEFISAGKIDNLGLTFCGASALIDSPDSAYVQVMAAFDNEEVGSTTANGANSSFMTTILERIALSLGWSKEELYQNYAKSYIISADTGHAVHPNYAEKHDPTNRPVLGGGPILKYSSNQRYVTNSETASMFKLACKHSGVPCQNFALRSDIVGGSTIGPAISSITSIPTVDIGTAILAMHSIREFASTIDHEYTYRAFVSFLQ